jgi:predicted protein tyrosine phosphatase
MGCGQSGAIAGGEGDCAYVSVVRVRPKPAAEPDRRAVFAAVPGVEAESAGVAPDAETPRSPPS